MKMHHTDILMMQFLQDQVSESFIIPEPKGQYIVILIKPIIPIWSVK